MATYGGSSGTVSAESLQQWRDRKRYLWLVALVMPMLPFAAVALNARTGQPWWLWLGPIVILGARAADRPRSAASTARTRPTSSSTRWRTTATTAGSRSCSCRCSTPASSSALAYLARADLTTVERVGLAVTIGFIGGLGINTAHELGHKKESHERWLAKIALAPSCYGHFYIEHNRGHHVRVATPDDPASSRLGESFYRFWPRTVVGSRAQRVAAGAAAVRASRPVARGASATTSSTRG